MSRACTVCVHPCHKDIDRQLIALVPYRVLAARWDLSTQALQRHKTGHLSAIMEAAVKREANVRGADLVEWMRDRTIDLRRITKRAEKKGKLATATGAIREERRHVEFIARLRGDLVDMPFLPPPTPGPTFQGLNLLLGQMPNDSATQLELVGLLRSLRSILIDRGTGGDPGGSSVARPLPEESGVAR